MKIVQKLLLLVLVLSLLLGVGAEAWAETLTLPSTLKTIGEEAFAGDSSLDDVVIPDGTVSIGSRAFADSSLTRINLPFSLNSIAEDAFQGTEPRAAATAGTYAYRWAVEHGLTTEGAVEGELSAAAKATLASNSAYASLTARRLTVDGIPLYEVFQNDGQSKPLVIILHGGAGGNKEKFFKTACDAALQGFYSVAMDCAACGESDLGPIDAVTCWSMTVSQIDALIEYYATVTQADAQHFGIWGNSMGGNIAFAYVVHGSYRPDIIVPLKATPDYSTLPLYVPGPLFDAFDHGATCPPVMTKEQIYNIAMNYSPINQPEKFLDVYIYSGNGTADTTTSLKGCKELETWLNKAGGTKHVFKYYEGCDHGDPYPNHEPLRALRWALIDNREQSAALAFTELDAYDYTQERAAFSDNQEIGLCHDRLIRDYQLVNYDTLAEKYEGEPEWSVEILGDAHGAVMGYQVGDWAGDGARAIDVGIMNEPETPCTLQYQVTCSWGDETITGNGTLVYRETALPTGVETLNEFRGLKKGESFTFRPAVTPEGYSFGDSEYAVFDSDLDCDIWGESEDGKNVVCIRPHEAGIFSAWLGLRYGNVMIRKRVTLYVMDENGEVPALQPLLKPEYMFNMYLPPEQAGGYEISVTTKTRGISLQNWELMETVYGDDFAWSFTSEEGAPDLGLTGSFSNGAFQFDVGNLCDMTADSDFTVRARLRWGTTEKETNLHFHFDTVPLPDSVSFDQDIRMIAGVEYRATVSVEPEDWAVPHFVYYNIDDSMCAGHVETHHSIREEPKAFYLRASEPGYYLARPRLVIGDNAAILGDFFTISAVHGNGWNVEDKGVPDDVAAALASNPALEGVNARELMVEGIPLLEAYRNDGQAKPLVFILHGAGGNKSVERFRRLALQFAAEGFYSVTIDLAACGDSAIGPINAPTLWNMTVRQLDLLVEYYDTAAQADAAHFGLWGLSFGGIISFIYAAHGKYTPTIIASMEATPDLSSIGNGSDQEPVFGPGSDGVITLLSGDELESFRMSMQPTDRPEKLASVYIYAVNRPPVDTYNYDTLKALLIDHNCSTQKLFYESCTDGAPHGAPMQEYDQKSHLAFRQTLLHESIEGPITLVQ